MNLSTVYKILLLVFTAISMQQAEANSSNIICLTSRVAENLPTYKSSFENAAYLALQQSKAINQVIIKTYFYANNPLAPAETYSKLKADNCSAIIGFEYLSDLLLAIKLQNNTNIPIFTSYASTENSNILPKNIFIFMPSYKYLAEKMVIFLQHKFGKLKNVLIITDLNREAMLGYKEAYTTLFKKERIKYDTLDILESDDQLVDKVKNYTHGKKYNYVFLLSGALTASKIANLMNDHQTIFIGTENFGSSVEQSFYIRLSDKVIRAYFVRNIDFLKFDPKLQKFRTVYIAKYHAEPTVLSAYTYDATRIILETLEKKGTINTDNIFQTNYDGITGAYIKDGAFHRSNKYVILSIGKNGYYAEK